MGEMVCHLDTTPVLDYLAGTVPLDGDMNQVRAIDQTPDGTVTYKGVHSGRHCSTEHFPTKMEWGGPNDPATIGDFNRAIHGVLQVSERGKAFVEMLEPGVHQFVSFTMLKDGQFLEDRYFWVVGNRLDSVDREHSQLVLLAGKMWRTARNVAESFPDYLPPGTDVDAPPKWAFNREQIGGAHVWRDKFIDSGGPLVSQAFADALNNSGLTGFRLIEAGEVV